MSSSADGCASACSVRFVPDQRPEDLVAKLKAHVEAEFAALRSGNSVSVRVKSVGDWWEADPQSKLFRLAERALYKEWQVWPLYVREGGTMVRPASQALCFRRPRG